MNVVTHSPQRPAVSKEIQIIIMHTVKQGNFDGVKIWQLRLKQVVSNLPMFNFGNLVCIHFSMVIL